MASNAMPAKVLAHRAGTRAAFRGRVLASSPPIVRTAGRFTVARFERSSVVVDPERRAIYELRQVASRAFDVLSDLAPALPATGDEAEHLRSAIHLLRREILGEELRLPRGPFSLDDAYGDPLFRRYPEPDAWRDASVGAEVEVRGALVRLAESTLVLHGGPSALATFARAFRSIGATVEEGSISLDPTCAGAARVGAGAPGVVTDSWAVSLGTNGLEGLQVAHVSAESALVHLLVSTRARPGEPSLSLLARFAEAVRHFRIVAPRGAARVTGALERFPGLA